MMKVLPVCVLVLGVSFGAAAQPSFVAVGDLPGGLPVSYAGGTSADGSVVTGFSYSDQGVSAFRWTEAGGIQELPRSNGPGTYETGFVSPSGNYISGRYQGLGAVWSEATGTVQVGDLPGGSDSSFVWAVNDQGTAVGQASYGFNSLGAPLFRATRWTASGGLEALPFPTATDEDIGSVAWSLLDDGRVFGQSASGAWLYSDSEGFEMLPGAEGMGESNSDGTFIVGQVLDPTMTAGVPAYWTRDGGLQYLPGLAFGQPGNPTGLSDDGSVIVGRRASDQVVWIDQGEPVLIRDYAESLGIDMTGWTILNVFDVSADGTTIIGGARHSSWVGPGFRVEGFVLTIPAPGAAVVFGFSGLLVQRRRRCLH